MNKKLFLLPILSLSLLVGCSGNQAKPSTSGEPSQSGSQSQKEIWEEDEVEGESTIAQVKAGEAGQYYTVRGTVVANSGSTLAIYRKGQFLYCYNFKAEAHEGLENHPLGAYVEIHAQSSVYNDGVQLTAFDVGTDKTDAKYDKAATLKVLKEKGETVAPVKLTTAEQLSNANATGVLMEIEFVAGKDFEFKADATSNQDLDGQVNGTDLTIRLESYLPTEVKTALLAANPTTIEDHATYKFVGLGAARSDGIVRCLLVDSSSWSKTADASFADPTSVVLETTDDIHEVEAGSKLKIDWAVLPENAKQAVTWTSSNEEAATVKDGVVTGVAAGKAVITAAATAKPEVKAEFEVTVKAAAVTYTSIGALSFKANDKVVITNELDDATDPKITYAENGVNIVVRKNTSDNNVNVWKATYSSARIYVGHEMIISSETAFKRVVLSCDEGYAVFKDSAEGVIEGVTGGASVSYDGTDIVLELATAAKSLTIVPDKQIRPNNVELFAIAE